MITCTSDVDDIHNFLYILSLNGEGVQRLININARLIISGEGVWN